MSKPVAIVGANRTGTTFLNRLFAAHPDCWAYTNGEHQEVMDAPGCPPWLSRYDFLTRWGVTTCPPGQERQTRQWFASLGDGKQFAVCKAPHWLVKTVALSSLVPEIQFVVCIRSPGCQMASSVATDNPPEYIRAANEGVLRFFGEPHPPCCIVRYEDLCRLPTIVFRMLCRRLWMRNDLETIQECVAWVGVEPSETQPFVPPGLESLHAELCEVLGYDS